MSLDMIKATGHPIIQPSDSAASPLKFFWIVEEPWMDAALSSESSGDEQMSASSHPSEVASGIPTLRQAGTKAGQSYMFPATMQLFHQGHGPQTHCHGE
jgi:hypothetical protein